LRVPDKIINMTYGDKFRSLHRKFEFAGARLMRAQKSLDSILGWGDSTELAEFMEARREFQEIAEKHKAFLDMVRKEKIKPNQEVLPATSRKKNTGTSTKKGKK
jgi:hypothetical protein